jgi:hypothetical protein
MSTEPAILNRADEDILTYETSDEALEIAAATAVNVEAYSFSFCTSPYTCPWS